MNSGWNWTINNKIISNHSSRAHSPYGFEFVSVFPMNLVHLFQGLIPYSSSSNIFIVYSTELLDAQNGIWSFWHMRRIFGVHYIRFVDNMMTIFCAFNIFNIFSEYSSICLGRRGMILLVFSICIFVFAQNAVHCLNNIRYFQLGNSRLIAHQNEKRIDSNKTNKIKTKKYSTKVCCQLTHAPASFHHLPNA